MSVIPARVAFFTDSEETAEQFVREYLLDAIERAPAIDGCDGLGFSLNELPNPDGGSVTVTVLGEADTFLNAEESTWGEYRQAGTLQDWEVERLPQGQYEANRALNSRHG